MGEHGEAILFAELPGEVQRELHRLKTVDRQRERDVHGLEVKLLKPEPPSAEDMAASRSARDQEAYAILVLGLASAFSGPHLVKAVPAQLRQLSSEICRLDGERCLSGCAIEM